MNRLLLAGFTALFSLSAGLGGAEPKKLLVVSTTLGTRDASIPNGEKMLRELAAKSNGLFSVVMMSDAPAYPFSRVPVPVATPGRAGRGAPTGFAGQVPTANAEQQAALTAAGAPLAALLTAATTARTELSAAAIAQPGGLPAKAAALAAAELNLALARASAFAQIQASANRLSPEQAQALAGTAPAAGRAGAAAGRGAAPATAAPPDNGPVLAKLFQEYLSPAALRNYDGIIFLSATGNLPFPDREAFMKWVSDGHAVVALHAAMNTGYETPEAYVQMLSGGSHYASSPGVNGTARKVYKVDATHPATKDWPDGLVVVDEFAQFNHQSPRDLNISIPGLDRTKVHSLLDFDYDGQRLAVAWTKMQGRGRVFYTSLGHRDDVMLPGTPAMDGNAKLNPDAVSTAYQTHVLNGIRWALGLVDGNTSLGNAK